MVIGELNEFFLFLLFLVLVFFGGLIIGVLKICVMEVIDELEFYCWNIYCGSVFYMGFCEDMDLSICIRIVLVENCWLYCWVGGGIVLDLVFSEEY